MAKTGSQRLADEIIKARKLLGRGNRAEALAIYYDVESEAGTDANLQYLLGRLCEELGDSELAVSHFLRAVEDDADNAIYLGALGCAQLSTGHLEQALETLSRAEAIDATNPEVLRGLGIGNLKIRDYDKALEYLQAACDRKPGNTMLRSNLAIVLMNLNRHDEALEHARKAARLDPSNPEIVHAYCGMLSEVGQADEAAALLQKGIRKHPGFGKFYHLLSKIRKFSAEDDRSVRQAEKALDRGMSAESRVYLLFALGNMHNDRQRYDDAFAHYSQANLLARKDFDAAADARRMKSMRSLFSPDLLEKYRSIGSDSAQPVFIVGMPRSGTTLMEQMIASHPHVDSAGELNEIHEICYRIFPPESRSPSAAQLHSALSEDAARDLVAAYLGSLRTGRGDAARIVDKAPLNCLYIGLIAVLFPRATIIHAVRNALDTCLSCYFQNFEQYSWSNDFHSLAAFYTTYRETMDYWKQALPQVEILDLPYERLVEDPQAQARRMIEACGLEWDDAVLDYPRRQSVIRTASLAQARQPVYRSSQRRWRHYSAHIGELASLLSDYLDDTDREYLVERGVKLDRRGGGGWLKRMFR